MAFQPHPHDVVSGEQYRYALTNFRIAHEKVEQQRLQLEEQEKQVALLRQRIALLEGAHESGDTAPQKRGGSSVDDFSIRNSASKLEKLVNRWAAEVVRVPPVTLADIRDAALSDVGGNFDPDDEIEPSPTLVQNLLRHSMSEVISEGVVNCLLVTNSIEANIQLTRIHEHLFTRDPTVACVWRRQTFSAAVESCTPEMATSITTETLPTLAVLFSQDGKTIVDPVKAIIDAAVEFSRMLHGSKSVSGGTTDTFYRAFCPELGSMLLPGQIELVRRCLRSERGEGDRVGATVFPGLVKVSKAPAGQPSPNGDGVIQTVVRRAQVMCECALNPHLAGMGIANNQPQPPYQ